MDIRSPTKFYFSRGFTGISKSDFWGLWGPPAVSQSNLSTFGGCATRFGLNSSKIDEVLSGHTCFWGKPCFCPISAKNRCSRKVRVGTPPDPGNVTRTENTPRAAPCFVFSTFSLFLAEIEQKEGFPQFGPKTGVSR